MNSLAEPQYLIQAHTPPTRLISQPKPTQMQFDTHRSGGFAGDRRTALIGGLTSFCKAAIVGHLQASGVV